jgi:hypothetical protein
LSQDTGGSEKWRALRAARFADLAWRGERLAAVQSRSCANGSPRSTFRP